MKDIRSLCTPSQGLPDLRLREDSKSQNNNLIRINCSRERFDKHE